MRSYLFVPGDSAAKLDKALGSGADALIIDLEDSVAPASKQAARETAAAFLAEAARQAGAPRLYVRVNDLASGLTDDDLATVMSGAPHGIVLPKAAGGADIEQLSAMLRTHEAANGAEDRSTAIMAIATETAQATLAMASYAGCSPRLEALSWGAEDLSADIGASASRDAHGALTGVFALARNLTVLGAAAAGVEAIDTVFVDFRDADGLEAECRNALRDGFTGKLAIHPAQVPVINACFTPDADTIAEARAVVAAFAGSGDTGVTSLNGKMLDRPHLRRAERILQRAGMTVS